MLSPLGDRCRTFGFIGLVVGVILSLVAGILSLATAGAQLERLGLSFLQVILTYLVACPIGGVAFAVMLPLKRTRIGAILIGFSTVFPLYLACALLIVPKGEWIPAGLVVGLIAALMIGVPVGYMGWHDEYGEPGKV